MKIFLTGGTGLLGKSVVKRLLKDKHDIYILTRKIPNSNLYNHPNIKLIKGSLENIEMWEDRLLNIDVMIHMAAPVVFWGDWDIYDKGIVKATENMLKVAIKRNIKRFIYISSESVLQNKKDLINVDENCKYPKLPNSYYGIAKKEAEEIILNDNSEVIKIILRPSFIWGNDVPAINIFKEKVINKQFILIDKGNIVIEMVHVDNIAEAIALSCEKGKNKDIFFITDDSPKTVKKFIGDLLEIENILLPSKSLPKIIIKPIAIIIEWIWKIFKIKSYPPLTRFDLSFISMNRRYNITAAKEILGYRPIVSYEEGLNMLKRKN